MADKTSGQACFVNYAAYFSWYSGLDNLDAMEDAYQTMCALVAEHQPRDTNYVSRTIGIMFQPQGAYGGGVRTKQDAWDDTRKKAMARISQLYQFSVEFEQPLNVGLWAEQKIAFIYLGNPECGIVVPSPEKYLEYIPQEDFSDVTPAELRARLSVPIGAEGQLMVPADQQASLTTSSLTDRLTAQNSELEKLQQEEDDIRHAKTGELASIQAQIDALQATLEEKKSALMEQLQEKMAEMESMKEALENQIYLLDSQLYAIRCYAGEVVKFAHIRTGKNAPNTEPIIIYQKLRFLDEDLGRIASLYELQWEKLGLFESFLRHHPLALETFAPNERCIVLVRLSRTARTFDRKSDAPYSNMLEDYEYYHGRTVGIIIRNGENLYLGWTDEDRVHINDDLILSRVITDISPVEEDEHLSDYEKKRREKEAKAEQRRVLDGFISRSFVYNVLQGIVDHSTLLPLPAGVKLNQQSEYVVYSMADNALTDNRFGSFTSILALCNSQVNEGDWLLTVQFLLPERNRSIFGGWTSDTWNNVRGRGDRNRTRDCSVDDCRLYQANVVEYDDPVEYIKYKYASGKNPDGSIHYSGPYIITADRQLGKNSEVLDRFTKRERHVFVSVPKTEGQWRGTNARANFELFDGEFINLTYLNSVWLEWVITNNKLGGWTIGGKTVDYAYAIRYLKMAMEHIRAREKTEKQYIDAENPDICKDPDWPLKLSQWKLDKGVRTISPYQAKRFAKAYPSLTGIIPLNAPEE